MTAKEIPLFRILALIAMLPLLLGNSACDTIYRSLGLIYDDARSDTPNDSEPNDEAPYLKQSRDAGSVSNIGMDDTCGASAYASYIGGNYSALEALRSPTDNWRAISPGMAVTEDYRPSRMNIELDGGNVITQIYCS